MKNIIVTGASQGIGYGVAKRLLDKGNNVILVSRKKDKLLELNHSYPDNSYVFSCDLRLYDKIEDIFIYCREKGIKLDGLVHAAGVSINKPARSIESDEMLSIMETNYFSLVHLGKNFLKKKYSNECASLVAISSMVTITKDVGLSQYAASKAAINSYIQILAKEMISRKQRANAIAPGYVNTDMARSVDVIVEDFNKNIMNIQPFGLIPVDEVVNLVEFLLSDESGYITGDVINISGGLN